MSNELRLYKSSVVDAMRRSRETKQAEVFENEGPDHARIVFEVMLENSTSTLDVVSCCMDKRAWPIDKLSHFMRANPEAVVRVLLEQSGSALPPASALAALDSLDRIQIRTLPIEASHHFCVADGRDVRLEYQKATCEASIVFGDPEGLGKAAGTLFNTLWAASAAP